MSFSEEALIRRHLPEENVSTLHDALQDIELLKKLVESLNITTENLKKECQSIQMLETRKKNKKDYEANKASLIILKNIVTDRIINKMAKEGISKNILIDTYNKNPKDGIKLLLSISINKKVRVTSNKNIILAKNEKIKEFSTIIE